MHGAEAIPGPWLEPLELRDVTASVAQDLHAFNTWKVGGFGDGRAECERIRGQHPGF